MPEEEIENQSSEQAKEPRRPRKIISRPNVLAAAGAIAIFGLLLTLVSVVSYKYGVFDSYIKAQFTAKMADIGVVFDASVFRVTVNPLELELKDATFNDKVTGDKLFLIRDAHLSLKVQDLFSRHLSRDVHIDKTEIRGAEVWVRFDENGRSNFSNINLVEDQAGSAVNFKYESVDFSLSDSVVHFGDLARKISANAKNLSFLLSPEDLNVSDEQKRYKFDIRSTGSNFVYDERSVDDISLDASGVASRLGAEISSLEIKTPIGDSTLSGKIENWAAPKYAFDIRSSVDMTQASGIFTAGTPIVGVGNFKGTLTGEGEAYKIVGEADSESLRAAGVSLKGLNVAATVDGTNASYQADGTAIARMLTFEDYRVDFLKLVGNVMGTGTDFRWLGELQAAAARSPSMTLGGLYLSDALAEYKDRQLRIEAGNGRSQKFSIKNNEFADLSARNLKFSSNEGLTKINSSDAHARAFTTEHYSLQGLTGHDLKITHRKGETKIDVDDLESETADIKGAKVKGVTASSFRFTDLPSSTNVILESLKAAEVYSNGIRVDGLDAPEVAIKNTPAELTIYSDKNRVAKVNTGSAIVGSLNIAGVRMTIRQGRVEVRSNDIDAGNVVLTKTSTLPDGGNLEAVKISDPVYILEPSGRYRATADMSLGGGTVGSVALGEASAKVELNNNRVELNDLTAKVMDGSIEGQAIIALNDRSQSTLRGNFTDLDISKLLALQGGRITPIVGQTDGSVDLTFAGTNFATASGRLDAEIAASAGSEDSGTIPINGRVNVSATNGLFNIDTARLATENSTLDASGRFDLKDNDSNLALALNSADAAEIQRLVRALDIAPAIEEQIDSMRAEALGKFKFDGTVTGNLSDPVIDGRASLDTISLRGRELGSVATQIHASPDGVELRDGKLQEAGGGIALFAVSIPRIGSNNIEIKATLSDITAGNLLAALPMDLPERIRDFTGQTSGSVDIRGLPDNAQGAIDLAAAKGTLAGQNFDDLKVTANFSGKSIDLETAKMGIGNGRLDASGKYDRATEEFNVVLGGKSVPVPLVVALFPRNDSIPLISGDLDFDAKASGFAGNAPTYVINFSGAAPNIQVGETALGRVSFQGATNDQILTADLTASLDGNIQVIAATVNFADEDLPLTATTNFDQSPIAPFLAFIPSLKGYPITGTGTGTINLGGNLSTVDPNGNRVFSVAGLKGTAAFSQLALQVQDTPLAATEPVLISFSSGEIVFENAKFGGGGSNMTISGTKALGEAGSNNLSIDGRVNLNLLNLVAKDIFFSGFADTSIRYFGPNSTARLTGTANLVNGSVAAFLGSDRFTVERLKARVIFTSNQVEVDGATGYLGGGKFTGAGGGTIDGLSIQAFRFALDGTNVTVPLPKDFVTTGDAKLEFTGQRETPRSGLQLTIAGRVFARKAVYSKDIDLASLVSGRRDPVLSGGSNGGLAPRFDLTIEGRNALIVKNNIADLTASVSLVLTGDTDNPRLSGRISANSGTIFFRKERYDVQRGVLEFPPDTAIEPVINLQAETEISGYQVFVNLSGPLTDSELLSATVRSSPALPQADVVSLITTGSLTNTVGGIPTLAQTGINTAAEILTDSIINNPARKATDKLFGLNVFEIDPLISGEQLNPTARLTVGRQINNNLRVTYATNLSQDQKQVLALEYRVSNRLSFVAQYEQRSLNNVTRNRDNFSFEIRLRKRF